MKGERHEAGFSPLLLYKFRLRNDLKDAKFDGQYLENPFQSDKYAKYLCTMSRFTSTA